jgi:hypothetical protein
MNRYENVLTFEPIVSPEAQVGCRAMTELDLGFGPWL